jgi:hypothetical protein
MGSMLAGCLSKSKVNYQELSSAVVRETTPRSVAVLPFFDLTDTSGIEKIVRISFYSHFSVTPYRDIELQVIDKKLKENRIHSADALRKIPVAELGKIIGCDAVVFGEVTEFKRVFLGIYSQLSVGAAISVWDTRTGRRLWADQHTVRNHEGGIPFSLLEIPFISLRSGWNLRDAVKINVVDELCRYFAGRIPIPDGTLQEGEKKSIVLCEVQVGAFWEKDHALAYQHVLKERGYLTKIRSVSGENGYTWHRVVLGPFADKSKAEKVQRKFKEELGADAFIVLLSAGN